MTTIVEKIADQIRSLPRAQLDEFLAWLADFELQHADQWDKEMEQDCLPGGCLQAVIDRRARTYPPAGQNRLKCENKKKGWANHCPVEFAKPMGCTPWA